MADTPIAQNDDYNKIRDLARTRILELQTELQKKHNLKTRCGIEVEFFVEDPTGNPKKLSPTQMGKLQEKLLKSAYVERLYKEANLEDHFPLLSGAAALVVVGLNNPPLLTAAASALNYGIGCGLRYYTTGSLRHIPQYEFVLGESRNREKHRENEKNRIKPMDCFKAAIAAEYMKKFIAEELEDIGEVSYVARPRKDRIVSGMHINVSLEDAEGNNQFAGSDNALMELAGQHLRSLQRDAALLFLPSEASMQRLKGGKGAPEEYRIDRKKHGGRLSPSVLLKSKKGTPDATRLENRLPGADVDPYLGVLVTLGALCRAADRKKAPDCSPRLHLDMDAQKTAFRESSEIKELLGDALCDAINGYIEQYGDLQPAARHQQQHAR